MRTAAAIVALLSLAAPPAPQLPATNVIATHFTADGPRYQYVPFDLPADVEALTITYRYTGDDGSSVIDLGLFEPGPLTIGTPGFRGYSGGAKRTITVGRRAASPGYKTGPLPPGTWHVLLGMYKVAPAGVNVEVTIAETKDEGSATGTAAGPKEPALQPARVGRVLSDQPKWYAGALHLHTTHSDGSFTPVALAEAARAAGFDFIAITDHNNTFHTREPLPSSPLHIVGEEVTTPGGHANVWGLPEGAWIDFRVSPKDPHAAAAIDGLVAEAHRAGALFSINHPIDNCAGCSWDQAVPDGIDAVEIWQNEKAPRDAEVAFWDRLLLAGRQVTAVGVSDWHRLPAPIGRAATRVLADRLTQPAILDGLRRGHVVVMRDATTAPPSLRARCGSSEAGIGDSLTCGTGDDLAIHVSMPDLPDATASFVWNAARMTTRTIGRGTTFTMPAAAGYLRVHVYAADGRTAAITNPVYVQTR